MGIYPLGDAIFPRYPVRQIGERLQARPRSIEHEVRKGAAAGFACRPAVTRFCSKLAYLSTPQLGSDYLPRVSIIVMVTWCSRLHETHGRGQISGRQSL